jgi:hypothetical protein
VRQWRFLPVDYCVIVFLLCDCFSLV